MRTVALFDSDEGRLVSLPSATVCSVCACHLPRTATARWDPLSQTVICITCDGGSVRAAAPEPASRDAWVEERSGAFLERGLVGVAMVLRNRRLSRTPTEVDHVVVAPSGVWVVSVRRADGVVERGNSGTLFRPSPTLLVNGRDSSDVLAAVQQKVAQVRGELTRDLGVRGAVCFAGAQGERLAQPFELDGVLVTTPTALLSAIREPGRGVPVDVQRIVALLDA